MPGMGNPGGIIPYIAASWLLGSIAAIAANSVEFGFLGSRPMLCNTIGSNLGFLGSKPRAAAVTGSSFGFLGSIPNAANSIGSIPPPAAAEAAGAALALVSMDLLEAGLAIEVSFLGSMPRACSVLGSIDRAAISIGSIFNGFLGSPRPNMAAVIGSSFFGSNP